MSKPKTKRRYKGVYYHASQNAFKEFAEKGNLVQLIMSLCYVANGGVCYSWQMAVFEREIQDAYEQIKNNLIIFTGE